MMKSGEAFGCERARGQVEEEKRVERGKRREKKEKRKNIYNRNLKLNSKLI